MCQPGFTSGLAGMAGAAHRLGVVVGVGAAAVHGVDVVNLGGCAQAAGSVDLALVVVAPEYADPEFLPVRGVGPG